MKVLRLWACLVVVWLLLFGATTALAAGQPIFKVMESKLTLPESEKTAIEAAIANFDPLTFLVRNKHALGDEELKKVQNPSELVISKPYKIYLLSDEAVKAIIEGKPLSPLLKNCQYYWLFPVLLRDGNKPVASFNVWFHQGKWQVTEVTGGSPVPEGNFPLLFEPGKIASIAAAKGITEAEDYALFTLSGGYFHLIVTNGREYLVPVWYGRGQLENFGLKTGTVYTLNQIAASLGPRLSH